MLAVEIVADNGGLETSGCFEHPYVSIGSSGNYADVSAADQCFQSITVVDNVPEVGITQDEWLEVVVDEHAAYGEQIAEPRPSKLVTFSKTHVTAVDDDDLAFRLL
jgi:hypothetical protein